MLSYSMAHLSGWIADQDYPVWRGELVSKLRSGIDEFEAILYALSGGGGAAGTIANHPQTVGSLENITKEWQEVFRPAYIRITGDESVTEQIKIVNSEIESFVNGINEMVNNYSVYAKEKISRALSINEGLVLVIIIVTLYSFAFNSKRIGKPMNLLMHELKELSLVNGTVSDKLRNLNKDELTEITLFFNEMMFDQLTKAYNRRAGLARLDHMLRRGNRRHLKLSLCFVDINGLKDVNDQLGHKHGDELISSVVDCIRQEIREDDFIIRLGGDEFLVALNGIGRQAAEKVWERIKRRYEHINEHEKRRYVISVSHGIADTESTERPDMELLIKNADDRMYAEKKYVKDELKVRIIRD